MTQQKSRREVVFVINNEFSSSRFVDERPYREARALVEAGFGLTIMCTRLRPGHAPVALGDVPIERLPIDERSGLAHITILPVAAFIKKAFTDAVFHVHNPPDTLIFAGLGRTKILDIHDPWSVNAQVRGVSGLALELVRAAEKLALTQADFVVCPSVSVRDFAVERGVPKERIQVVMTCPELREPEDPSEARERLGLATVPVIVFEGVFHANRGLSVLIQAVKQIRQEMPNCQLLLVGDGPERSSLEELAQVLGISDAVRFVGWRPLDELPTYVAAADVCVIPSLSTPPTEMAPHNKLFDYMAQRKPIVASRLREISRIVSHGESSLLVTPGDAAELAQSVVRLLKNRRLASQIARKAYELFRVEYNWQVQGQRLVRLYERL